MSTDLQFRAEQRRRLYAFKLIAAYPEKINEFIKQTEIEMLEEDVAMVNQQVAEIQ